MATRAMEIEDVKTGEVTEAVYEHPFLVRLCHWVNAVSLFVMVAEGSPRLAQGSRAWRMAGRRAAMAPYLHVDLHRDRPLVHRLPALQRKLQAGALRTT